MVPGCKQLLRQVDASSALKRKGRKSVTNGTLARFVLASTAVIIPHFHAGTFFFLPLVLSCVFLPFPKRVLFSRTSDRRVFTEP